MLRLTTMNSRSVSERLALTVRVRTLRRSNDFLGGYAYPGLRALAAWRPTLIGVFRQAGSWGLTFAVTSTESELADPVNAGRLMKLYNRMQGILRAAGGTQVRFAGVLPGILFARGFAISHAE